MAQTVQANTVSQRSDDVRSMVSCRWRRVFRDAVLEKNAADGGLDVHGCVSSGTEMANSQSRMIYSKIFSYPRSMYVEVRFLPIVVCIQIQTELPFRLLLVTSMLP